MNSPRVHLILAVLFALAAVGGYVFWYLATTAAHDEAAALLPQVAAKEAASSKGSAVREALAALSAKETFISSELLAEGDAVSFLERLEATGKQFGAEVTVVSVDDSEKSAGSIEVSLSIQGSFDAVMRTLGALEHGTPAASAKSMTLTGGGGTWTANGILTVATTIATSTPPTP